MRSFSDFLSQLAIVDTASGLSETERAREALWLISEFFYFKTPDVPGEHISAFHAWWVENAQEILRIEIDEEQCRRVAQVLERHFSQSSARANYHAPSMSVDPATIANCRFFSAAQDFGGQFRRSPFELLDSCGDFFEPALLLDRPDSVDGFLRHIGAEAQYDKRRDFVRRGARWLVEEHGGQAFNLFADYGSSVRKLTKALTTQSLGMGYSAKKTHMMIRDLFDWGVWRPSEDIGDLDVASDANTMRIALRTGILKLGIPTLIPSYLDVYSPQYTIMDEMNVSAWRRVWELWGDIPGNHRVAAPAFFDFFIYSLGKSTCRKTSQRCLTDLACKSHGTEKCPAHGSDVCDGTRCPLHGICPVETRKLQPPKSISIEGRTGWKAGMTNEGGGLGITA